MKLEKRILTIYYLVILGQKKGIGWYLVSTWWYLVIIGRKWFMLDDGSIRWSGWYLVVLGQNRAVLAASVIGFQKMYYL